MPKRERRPKPSHSCCIKTKAALKDFDSEIREQEVFVLPDDDDIRKRIHARRRVGRFNGLKGCYKMWRASLLMHLKDLGLEHTLERIPPEEIYEIDGDFDGEAWASAYQKRCEQDCEAIDEMCTTMDLEPLKRVAHCTYAKDILDTLDLNYNRVPRKKK
ncbi:uncharacterized protein LOC129758134 [Uranotaenia lowii]|uniref:uncharacterized protein LOC129758134 n=1 Tax=Uranotaenia lowii TaxID=190385 RepID=UPI00247A788A|nr:uncharacterized protein LOC129758134 [Uranotaenia lowii]XP_055611568.1 uncharacterized protein LOC129758134 [Uranotaenia lowii]